MNPNAPGLCCPCFAEHLLTRISDLLYTPVHSWVTLQVFEVTIQTGSWPGSGTSSLPHLLLYGLEGKYEARQLEPADKDNLHLTTRDANGNCLFETGSRPLNFQMLSSIYAVVIFLL